MPARSTAILQTYSWHIKLGDKAPEKVAEGMKALAAILVRTRPVLRGLRLTQVADDRMHLALRVAGHTRWEIQRDARKLIVMLLRRVYIAPTDLELELVTTERNGRELYAGEGRTPMTKKPRAPKQTDGRPWDHYEWWGDELAVRESEEPTDLPRQEDPDHNPPASASPVPEVAPWL